MEPTFKLSAIGIYPGHDPQVVRAKLQPMMKNDAATFDDIFHRISLNQAVVLGENVPKEQAEKLQEKLTAIGLKCRLDSTTLSLVPIEEEQLQNAVYRCPACGHTQPPARGGNPDICERCGVVGQNYQAANELKQALEMERRRLKSVLDKEKKEKLEAVRDKADQQKEKAQQELLERARRQVEKELGIRPWHKLKALLKPRVLYPILGSLAVGLIGVGLLIWQLSDSTQDTVASVTPAGLPSTVTVTPAPGVTLTATGNHTPAPQSSASLAPGVTQTAAASPATAASPAAPGTGAVPASAGPQTGTPTATASQTGAAAGSTPASSASPPVQTVSLLAIDPLTLAPPTAGSTTGQATPPATREPHILAGLARYQIQTGDLAAAARSIDRASEWQSAERGSRSNRELEALNRMQAEVRAEIAHQHYQRREATTAQSHWFRATHLANSITTPSERAQVLSTLARTMNDAQAPTAENYFGRALAALPLITEPSSQTQVLGVVARNLAHAERVEQSQVLFEQAATTVKAIQNPEGRWMAQTILAKHHAEAGDAVVARILLEQIAAERGNPMPPEPNPHLVEALSALALSLAHRGDTATARSEFAAALEQAQRLTDPVLWAGTLLYLARDLAAAGDPETAAQLAAVAGTWD